MGGSARGSSRLCKAEGRPWLLVADWLCRGGWVPAVLDDDLRLRNMNFVVERSMTGAEQLSQTISNICDQAMGLGTGRSIIYALASKHQMQIIDLIVHRATQCRLLARIKVSGTAEESLLSQVIVVYSNI